MAFRLLNFERRAASDTTSSNVSPERDLGTVMHLLREFPVNNRRK
uniref:Uncharacterized protein n=1 Tax=Anguilla anguilla TaxID=7936 RepID=A0A0E9QWF9_ANGAN